jgi:hypothetical protein
VPRARRARAAAARFAFHLGPDRLVGAEVLRRRAQARARQGQRAPQRCGCRASEAQSLNSRDTGGGTRHGDLRPRPRPERGLAMHPVASLSYPQERHPHRGAAMMHLTGQSADAAPGLGSGPHPALRSRGAALTSHPDCRRAESCTPRSAQSPSRTRRFRRRDAGTRHTREAKTSMPWVTRWGTGIRARVRREAKQRVPTWPCGRFDHASVRGAARARTAWSQKPHRADRDPRTASGTCVTPAERREGGNDDGAYPGNQRRR